MSGVTVSSDDVVDIHDPAEGDNVFIQINGVYIGSLWIHDGLVTWGANSGESGDWVPAEHVDIPEEAQR